MGLLDSARVPRDRAYSGADWRFLTFGYGTVTLCGAGFHRLPLAIHLRIVGPTTPASEEAGSTSRASSNSATSEGEQTGTASK